MTWVSWTSDGRTPCRSGTGTGSFNGFLLEDLLQQQGVAGGWVEHRIRITPRDWPIEAVRGVPPATVNPPKAIAERIAREQAAVAATRTRDGEETGFAQAFIRPVEGRIINHSSGREFSCEKIPPKLMEIVAGGGLMPWLERKLAAERRS